VQGAGGPTPPPPTEGQPEHPEQAEPAAMEPSMSESAVPVAPELAPAVSTLSPAPAAPVCADEPLVVSDPVCLPAAEPDDEPSSPDDEPLLWPAVTVTRSVDEPAAPEAPAAPATVSATLAAASGTTAGALNTGSTEGLVCDAEVFVVR